MSEAAGTVLVADLGGTNTRVALAEGARLLPDTVHRLSNAAHTGLESVLSAYLEQHAPQTAPVGACVAVAGPVRDGRAAVTNLDWTIDAEVVRRATGAGTVSVLNDLQAQGHAIGRIDPANETRIATGVPADRQASKLVIGVGTGFNAAPVYEAAAGRYVPPSEAGHAGLPVRTEAEFRLCRFVETVHGFAAVEDVLSGRGLERVYAWLGAEANDERKAGAAEIIASCAAGSDPRAEQALRHFVRLFGAVAGNLALNYLPFGGVYLVGGVARRVGPHLSGMGFCEAFRDKGRFSAFMDNFAVTVVEDDFAALVGCASHLANLTD